MSIRLLMKALVSDIDDSIEGIRVMTFQPLDRDRFPPYAPGSHTIVRMRRNLNRQYSLCGATQQDYRIAVKLEPEGRGGSAFMHSDAVQVGTPLFISYPQPDFTLAPDDRSCYLIAGGIGITPILSFAYELARLGKPTVVHYCVRSRAEAAFLEELKELPVELHLHESAKGDRADFRQLLSSPLAGQGLYCCGSLRLMEAVKEAAASWPSSELHFEAFGGQPAGHSGNLGEAFVVDLPRSKHVLNVPSDKTLLQVLLEDGVALDYACEAGVCRSCIVDVTQGVIDHRDSCLTPEERKTRMTPCVSRGRGKIVIASL